MTYEPVKASRVMDLRLLLRTEQGRVIKTFSELDADTSWLLCLIVLTLIYRIVGVFKEYMIDIDFYVNILQPFTSNGDVNELCEWNIFIFNIVRYTLYIDSIMTYAQLDNISFIRRRRHCRLRSSEFEPLLVDNSLRAGRDVYRATTLFFAITRRPDPFNRRELLARGTEDSL